MSGRMINLRSDQVQFLSDMLVREAGQRTIDPRVLVVIGEILRKLEGRKIA